MKNTSIQKSIMKPLIGSLLIIWFGVAILLAANGAFLRSPETPPVLTASAVVIPVIIFLTAFLTWGAFRDFILAADIRLLTAIQAWRTAGFGFLVLYTYDLLPGLFAWPAGLGDVAIGITAPWMVYMLIRHPAFASSRRFVAWNLLGILDFVVAVTMGALSSGFFTAIPVEVTTAPMTQLPLVIIPAFLVPFFIILHLTAIFQACRLNCKQNVEQGGAASAYPRHAFCLLATLAGRRRATGSRG